MEEQDTNPTSVRNDESLHDHSFHSFDDHSTNNFYYSYRSRRSRNDQPNQPQPVQPQQNQNNNDLGRNRTILWSLISLLLGIALIVFLMSYFGGKSNSSTPINNSNTINVDNGARYYHHDYPRRGGSGKTLQTPYSSDYSNTIAENTGRANGYLQEIVYNTREITQNTRETNQKLDGVQREVSGLRSDVNNLRSDMNAGFSRNHQDLVVIQNQVSNLGQLGAYTPQREKSYWDGGNSGQKKSSDCTTPNGAIQ